MEHSGHPEDSAARKVLPQEELPEAPEEAQDPQREPLALAFPQILHQAEAAAAAAEVHQPEAERTGGQVDLTAQAAEAGGQPLLPAAHRPPAIPRPPPSYL